MSEAERREDEGGMIYDGKGLCWARHQLGWSHLKMARALRMNGSDEKLKSRLHEMEIGTRHVAGPVGVCVEAFLAGFRPEGFED